MSRGPAPTPTKVLESRGSWRASTRKGEFTPPPGEPQKPPDLSPEASRIWDFIVPELVATGILSKIDSIMLTLFCTTAALWWKEKEAFERLGSTYVIERDTGQVDPLTKEPIKEKVLRRFPHVGVFKELSHQVANLGAQFGMSPAARTRILAAAFGISSPISSGSQGDKQRFIKLA